MASRADLRQQARRQAAEASLRPVGRVEVVSLRRCDVRLRTGRVVLKGKTGPRQFPLSQETLAMLAPRANGSEAKLLDLGVKGANRIRKALTRACQNAGVQPFTPPPPNGLRRVVVDRATAVERAQLGVLLPKADATTPKPPDTSERQSASNPLKS